jgi:hypothetical protein
VRTLRQSLDAGAQRITWDGRDEHGNHAASGVYFARLEDNGKQIVHKMVLLR